MKPSKLRDNVRDALAGAAMLALAAVCLYQGQARLNATQALLDEQANRLAMQELELEFERSRLLGATKERQRHEARVESMNADIAQKRASMARFTSGVVAKDALRDRVSRLQSEAGQLKAEVDGFIGSVSELEAELEAASQAAAELAARRGKAEITDEAAREQINQYEAIVAEHKRIQARCQRVAEERRKQSDAQLAELRAKAEEQKRLAQEPTP